MEFLGVSKLEKGQNMEIVIMEKLIEICNVV